MARVNINKYLDDEVTASTTDVTTWDDIPNGETWHLDRFGACAGGDALVALQKRTATGPAVWKTVRMFACGAPGGHGEFVVDQDFVGDGTLKLRIVRQEKSGSNQEIICWAEGYKVT
jgi:hypothetical protein